MRNRSAVRPPTGSPFERSTVKYTATLLGFFTLWLIVLRCRPEHAGKKAQRASARFCMGRYFRAARGVRSIADEPQTQARPMGPGHDRGALDLGAVGKRQGHPHAIARRVARRDAQADAARRDVVKANEQ